MQRDAHEEFPTGARVHERKLPIELDVRWPHSHHAAVRDLDHGNRCRGRPLRIEFDGDSLSDLGGAPAILVVNADDLVRKEVDLGQLRQGDGGAESRAGAGLPLLHSAQHRSHLRGGVVLAIGRSNEDLREVAGGPHLRDDPAVHGEVRGVRGHEASIEVDGHLIEVGRLELGDVREHHLLAGHAIEAEGHFIEQGVELLAHDPAVLFREGGFEGVRGDQVVGLKTVGHQKSPRVLVRDGHFAAGDDATRADAADLVHFCPEWRKI